MSSNPITCEMEVAGSRFQSQAPVHEITSQNNQSCTQSHTPEDTLPQHLQKIHCNNILKGFGPTLKSEKCSSASDDTIEEHRAFWDVEGSPFDQKGKDTESQATMNTIESLFTMR